jgi:hypothetical protein
MKSRSALLGAGPLGSVYALQKLEEMHRHSYPAGFPVRLALKDLEHRQLPSPQRCSRSSEGVPRRASSSRNERKCVHVPRPHGAEVALVERCDHV